MANKSVNKLKYLRIAICCEGGGQRSTDESSNGFTIAEEGDDSGVDGSDSFHNPRTEAVKSSIDLSEVCGDTDSHNMIADRIVPISSVISSLIGNACIDRSYRGPNITADRKYL